MTCPEHDDLSAYLDGVLAPAESARLASHLAACPVCRGDLGRLEALRRSLQALPPLTPGFDLAARLEGRWNMTPRPARAWRPRWIAWVPGSVSAALALVAGVWLGSLLFGAGIGAPAGMATMRAFDPVPPGGLCAASELCKVSKGLR